MPGGGGLITIIVLIAVIWQIISVIVAHAQQQKQRQAEAEARRQRVTSRAGRPGERPSSPASLAGSESGSAHPKLSKLDELAARRQQQLDELRRRHESGRQPASASSGAQTGTNRGGSSEWEAGTQLSTGQRGSGTNLPTESAGREAPSISSRTSRRPSPGQKQQQMQQQQRLARQRQLEQQQGLRERAGQEEELRSRRRAAVPEAPAIGEIGRPAPDPLPRDAYLLTPPTPPDEPLHLDRVQELLHNRATLRELIVAKEVLDAPVSLREPRYA